MIVLLIVKSSVNGKDIALYNQEYKKMFVKKALESKFSNLVYDSETGISSDFIREYALMDTADRFYSNDFVSGVYKNINFEQADVHIEEKRETRDSKGRTRTTYVTIFRGRVMFFDFNKPFKANVLVVGAGFGAVGHGRGFEKVEMEDMTFNDEFSVYAEDAHEAFYILTPHYMEKLRSIATVLSCGVMFGFVDNRLVIAVDNRDDSFEANIFEEIDEGKINSEIINDINLITDLVEDFELHNDYFKR